MSTKELGTLLGTEAQYRVHNSSGSIRVDVTIIDAKSSYGRTLVQIAPIAGTDSMWVTLDNVATDTLKL